LTYLVRKGPAAGIVVILATQRPDSNTIPSRLRAVVGSRFALRVTLFDPDNVGAGHVIRFRRSSPDCIVRSRRPAHAAIVSVDDFVSVQLLRRSRAAGGLPACRKLERGPKLTKWVYPLRGRVRCGYCARRMEGAPRAGRTCYRCAARSLVPGSPALQRHPKNVYPPQTAVLEPLVVCIRRRRSRRSLGAISSSS